MFEKIILERVLKNYYNQMKKLEIVNNLFKLFNLYYILFDDKTMKK